MKRAKIDPTQPPDADLIARIAAYDHRWRLVREGHELVLYGNGAPAAFNTNECCHDWLRRWEKVKRSADARRAARKARNGRA